MLVASKPCFDDLFIQDIECYQVKSYQKWQFLKGHFLTTILWPYTRNHKMSMVFAPKEHG